MHIAALHFLAQQPGIIHRGRQIELPLSSQACRFPDDRQNPLCFGFKMLSLQWRYSNYARPLLFTPASCCCIGTALWGLHWDLGCRENLAKKKKVRVLKHCTVFLSIVKSFQINTQNHAYQFQKPEGRKKKNKTSLLIYLLIRVKWKYLFLIKQIKGTFSLLTRRSVSE